MLQIHQIRFFRKLGLTCALGVLVGMGMVIHQSTSDFAIAQVTANLFTCETSAMDSTYHLYAQRGADDLFHGSFSYYNGRGGSKPPENGRLIISAQPNLKGGGCIVLGRLRGTSTQMELSITMNVSADQLKQVSSQKFLSLDSAATQVRGRYADEKVELPRVLETTSLKGGSYVKEKVSLDGMSCNLSTAFVSSLDACKPQVASNGHSSKGARDRSQNSKETTLGAEAE